MVALYFRRRMGDQLFMPVDSMLPPPPICVRRGCSINRNLTFSNVTAGCPCYIADTYVLITNISQGQLSRCDAAP